MKKGLYYKILSIFSIVSLILINIAPFSIKADTGVSLSAPFIGYNVKFYDIDTEHYVSGANLNLKLEHLKLTCTNNITNFCLVYSQDTNNGNNSSSITNTISFSNNTTHKYIYEFTLFLDNEYIGYVVINNVKYFVNGNEISFKVQDTQNMNVSITDYSLVLNNSSIVKWDFPIESYSFASYNIINHSNKLVGINEYNSYNLPMFKIDKGDVIMNTWQNTYDNVMILGINQNFWNANLFTQYFNLPGLTEVKEFTILGRFYQNSTAFYLIKIVWSNNNYNRVNFTYNGPDNTIFMPILFNSTEYLHLSTDFALNFGMSNELLDNLNIIANGNQQSNDSTTQADTTNQAAEQIFTQEEQLVINAENDLNDKLTSLDIQNQNNTLFGNSKFIASANWVKSQFDNLTNNNAFGYLITFSLVIGLSLVIIGKLRG